MPGKARLGGERGIAKITSHHRPSAWGGHLFWECAFPGPSHYAETSVLLR
jgi:hypothetical protein